MIISKYFDHNFASKTEKEILNEITLWMEEQEKEIKGRGAVIQGISHSINRSISGTSTGTAIICWDKKEMKEEKVDGEKK